MEIEKRDCMCVRLRSGDKHHLRKSSDRKAEIRRRSFRSPDWFVLFDLKISSFYPPSATVLTHNLFFLFPIVFGINIFSAHLLWQNHFEVQIIYNYRHKNFILINTSKPWNSLTVLGWALHAVFENGRTDFSKICGMPIIELQGRAWNCSCLSKEASLKVLWQIIKEQKFYAKMNALVFAA